MANTHLPSCFAILVSHSVVARLHNQIRVLDEATRHRRKQRQLDNLEKDNFQEDPHASFAHLIGKYKLPTFSDSNEGSLHVQLFSVGESEDASMYLVAMLYVSADKGPKRRRKNKSTADHFKQVKCRPRSSST